MKSFIRKSSIAAFQLFSLAVLVASCGDGEKIVPLKQNVLNREIQTFSVGPSTVKPGTDEAEYFTLPATMTSPTASEVFKYRYGSDATSTSGLNEAYFIKIDSPAFEEPIYSNCIGNYYFPVTALGMELTISQLPDNSLTQTVNPIYKIESVETKQNGECRTLPQADIDEAGVKDLGASRYSILFDENEFHTPKCMILNLVSDRLYPSSSGQPEPRRKSIYLMQLPYANLFEFSTLKISTSNPI